RTKAFEAIVTDQPIPASSVPESFKVLMRELNSLGLEIIMKEPQVAEISDVAQEAVKDNVAEVSGQTVVADGEQVATEVLQEAPIEGDAAGVETGEENDIEEAQVVADDREPSVEELAEEQV